MDKFFIVFPTSLRQKFVLKDVGRGSYIINFPKGNDVYINIIGKGITDFSAVVLLCLSPISWRLKKFLYIVVMLLAIEFNYNTAAA